MNKSQKLFLKAQIEITLGFSEVFNNITGKSKIGLTSKFIHNNNLMFKEEFSNGFPVNLLLRKGNFPQIGLDKNSILICTGTGIAPIRFYLWERFEKHKQNKTILIGKTLMIYGCRNKKKDFLYSHELNNFKDEKNFK